MTTLILGDTTEASRLAEAMAAEGLPAVLSYAGRTEARARSRCPPASAASAGRRGWQAT